MNIIKKDLPSQEGRKMLETLRLSVSKTLEKKRRLGQYAVVWKNGRPVVMGEDEQSI
jgi:predicted solute-binding protein